MQRLTSASGELVLLEDRLTLRRSEAGSGAAGEAATEVPYRSISHVVLSRASTVAHGYLQFVIPGVNEDLSGRFRAGSDPNAFFFEHPLNDEVVRAKEYVERRLQAIPPDVRAAEAARLDLVGKVVQGIGEELAVFDDRLEITPHGVMGFLVRRLKLSKAIAYRSIAAIEHREAPLGDTGHVQITIAVGGEGRHTASFSFAADQNALVRRVIAYVDHRRTELRRAAAEGVSG